MKRRTLLGGLAALPLACATSVLAAAEPRARVEVIVFKNPSCGCCGAWVTHMQAAGFAVTVKEVADTGDVRRSVGLPHRFASCHTATVGGYAIEGHVPAAEVKRLLATKPAALGLAVPGMPMGSPGMEAGARVTPYDVLLVDRRGGASVFARYPKA